MHKYPLTFEDLCELEKKTLQVIAQNNLFMGNPGIAMEVPKAQHAKPRNQYCFNCYWDSTCELKGTTECRLFLSELFSKGSGKNDGDVVDMSICLCIAELDDNEDISRVFRKYHFDFTRDHEGGSRRQQHPMYHVQYAGKVSKFLEDNYVAASNIEHMDPELSEPRLFHYPMTLAMAFSIAFREFPYASSTKLFESSGWQKILRENEELVIKPFLNKFSELVSKADKKRDTLFDFLYTPK